MGIAQGRKLPRLTSRNFIRRAHHRRLTRPIRRSGQKVLYFVDIYANYFDPQLAEALVAVLEHNGVAYMCIPIKNRPACRRSPAVRWITPASWPNITSLFSPKPCGKDIMSWPPNRPRPSALRVNIRN